MKEKYLKMLDSDEFREGFAQGMLHMDYVLAFDIDWLKPSTRQRIMRQVRNTNWPHPRLDR